MGASQTATASGLSDVQNQKMADKQEKGEMKPVVAGARFGRLTVLSKSWKDGSSRRFVACRCKCGRTRIVRVDHLKSENTKSCGCLSIDLTSNSSRALKHGHCRGRKVSPEYKAWCAMKDRCNNPKCREYRYYGGRGIKICSSWQRSFAHFFRQMGPKPSPHHSLDRKNNNGNYQPQNCRWATRSQQMLNRRPFKTK